MEAADKRVAKMRAGKVVQHNLRESIRFQKDEIAKLKAEIFGADRKNRSRYIRDFVQEFRFYQEISSLEELHRQALQSRLILVGDFHALRSSQEFAASFVTDLVKSGASLVLGVEMLYGRNQKALEEWNAGIITEATFLRRIRYDMEWGYDWASFRRLFDVARRFHIPIFGIDCDPRTDLRLIHKRDACVAAKLLKLARSHPDRQIVAVFGESHLASGHLPKRIEELEGPGEAIGRPLVVLQNVDEIYWKLAQRGLTGETVVRVHENAFCVFNATPFVKYEAYRQTIEKWLSQQAGDGGDIYLTSTIYNLINAVLDFIKVDKYTYCLNEQGVCIEFMVDGYPEVYTHDEWRIFKSLLQKAGLPRGHVREILNHVARNGSCYVPVINAIFIGSFDLVHGAEEAAHFVNFACKEERLSGYRSAPRRGDDVFYVTVLEEAVAYLGSKLVAPTRDHYQQSPFLKNRWNGQPSQNGNSLDISLSALGLRSGDFEFIKKFILAHKSLELRYNKMSRVPRVIGAGIGARGSRRQWLVHELGYTLGEQIHRAYIAGVISRSEISDLFFEKFLEPGSALNAYMHWAERSARFSP